MFKINKIRDENTKNQNLNEQLLNTIKKTITLLENIFLYGVFPSSFFILLIQISTSKSFKSNLFKLLIDDADAIVDEVTVETDDHTNSLDRKHVDTIEGKSRSDTIINNSYWNSFVPYLPYIGFAALTVVVLCSSEMIIHLVSDMKSTKDLVNGAIQQQADDRNTINDITSFIKILFNRFQNSGNSSRDTNNE